MRSSSHTCHINVLRSFAGGQENIAQLLFTHSRKSSADIANKHIHVIEQWKTTLARASTRNTCHDACFADGRPDTVELPPCNSTGFGRARRSKPTRGPWRLPLSFRGRRSLNASWRLLKKRSHGLSCRPQPSVTSERTRPAIKTQVSRPSAKRTWKLTKRKLTKRKRGRSD